MYSKNNTFLFFTVVSLMALFSSCNQTKYVGEDQYLYKQKTNSLPWNAHKRTIHFVSYDKDSNLVYSTSNDLVYTGDLYDYVRPEPNRALRLFFYNQIDTTKMNRQIKKNEDKAENKNKKKKEKEIKINRKRNDKAKAKGKTEYTQKIISPAKVKPGWRFWIQNKMGEPPSIFDSLKVDRSNQQMNLLLQKKGFYNAHITDTIIYKKNKAYVRYSVYAGTPYQINEVTFDNNPKYAGLNNEYKRMIKKNPEKILYSGDLLDQDKMEKFRDEYSKFCRDNTYYGFNKNYIYYVVDTTVGNHKANVTIRIKDKFITDPNNIDTVKAVPHQPHKISNVTYYVYNPSPSTFKDFDAYEKRLKEYGLSYTPGNYPLLDTLRYVDTAYTRKYVFFGPVKRTLVYRGTFIYNQELPISPFLFDRHNFLEETDGGDNGWYREYYMERTYSTMLGLGIFGSIKPTIELDPNYPNGGFLHVKYELTPSEKQSFSIEPRGTNSNGFLGVSASINYMNKNLFKGAQKLKITFVGGLESQPAVFDRNAEGETIKASGRSLNTFEFSPKITYQIPRISPLPRNIQKTVSKRLYPSTVIDLGFNYQKRVEFTRNITEFAYSWKFQEDKSKTHHIKWQSFNYVKLNKEPFFQERLDQLNDPFLLNAYNDHFSNKFVYGFLFNNQREQREFGKFNYLYNNVTFTTSGFLLDKFGVGLNSLDEETGLRQFLSVPFTQFVSIDNDLRYFHNLNAKNTKIIAMRLLTGIGYAYGNSPSLPYEQSFFAGGANDIRAFQARTMAPGGMRTWADTTSTITQIGDIRLELNLEYRFQFSDFLKAAWFIDAGNIWKIQDDPTTTNDDLGVFGPNFYRQVAIGGGFGLRMDADFFIIRLDLAIPIHNPYMYPGERWIWEERTQFYNELSTLPESYTRNIHRPFLPRINVGIGFPF